MKYPHLSKRNFLVGFLIAGSVALSLLYLSKHLSEHLFPTLKTTLQITARIDRTDSQKILWSPDGRYIAFDGRPPRSRTTNFEITVWDNVEKRIVATTPRAFTGNYFSMGFVPESLEIAFPVPTKNGAQEKNAFGIWDWRTQAGLRLFKGPYEGSNANANVAHNIALTPDRKSAVVFFGNNRRGGVVAAYDLSSQEQRIVHKIEYNGITALAVSPDGRLLALGSYNGDLSLIRLNVEEPPIIIKAHGGILTGLAFSPDARLLATGGNEGQPAESGETDGKIAQTAPHTIRLWDLEMQKEVRSYEGPASTRINDLVWSPDGRFIASAESNGTVRLLDATSSKNAEIIARFPKYAFTVAFSPDSKMLAVGGDAPTAIIQLEK